MSEICNIKLSTMVNRNTCHRFIHKEKKIYIYISQIKHVGTTEQQEQN